MLARPELIRGRVPRTVQSQAVASVIGRFFSLIYSAEAVTLKSGVATLSDLVHNIGQAFADRVVEDKFNDNVPLRFTVDRGVSTPRLSCCA